MKPSENALYYDVYSKLLSDIKNGEYTENSLLPPEKDLCEKYHVSRSTVRKALQLLKDEDILYSLQGTGTYVKPQTFTQPLAKIYSFTDTLKKSNILIKNDIISYDLLCADSYLSNKTNYPEGTAFHKLFRLRSAEDYPLMTETTYLPLGRFIKLNLDYLQTGSLYEYLRTQYNFKVQHAVETFRPVNPTQEECRLLSIPSNVSCILLERFSYEDDILVEYTKAVVRGDKYIFRVELSDTN